MKLKTVLVLSLLTLFGLSLSLQAQEAAPRSPLISRLPAQAAWSIDYKYRSDTPAAGTEVSPTPTPKPNPFVFADEKRTTTVRKSTPVWNEQILWKSGAKTETWIDENRRVGIVPGTTRIVVMPFSAESAETFDYRRLDFEGLEWLSLANYRGPVKWQGQPAYLFEEGDHAVASAGRTPTVPVNQWPGHRWAVISADKQLPLIDYNGFAERTYRYLPIPTDALVPPKKFLDLLNQLPK